MGTHGDELSACGVPRRGGSGVQWTSSEVSDLVRRRFFRFTDPLAMGVPQYLLAHFIVCCKSSSTFSYSSTDPQLSTSTERNHADLDIVGDIVTRLHMAANQLKPPCKLFGSKPKSLAFTRSYPILMAGWYQLPISHLVSQPDLR